MNAVLETALAWHAAGFSVLPISPDGSKRPDLPSWTEYCARPASVGTLQGWFGVEGRHGLGIVMGAVSGNAEMLELEPEIVHHYVTLAELAEASGLGELWARVNTYRERSGGGGLHWIYRVDGPPVTGAVKLAMRPATPAELAADPHARFKTLAETKGEGGQTVAAPTPGTFHPNGGAWLLLEGATAQVPTITGEEREALHDLFRTLDQRSPVEQPAPRTPSQPRAEGDTLPGDDFEDRTDWADILTAHGWTFVFTRGRTRYWRRPGKTIGVSATTGNAEDRDRLFVFTSSSEFEVNTPYTKFAAYAVLNHGGDYGAAGRQLYADGYGTRKARTSSLAGLTDPFGAPVAAAGQPAAAEAAAPLVDDVEAFWKARPELEHVRDYARARRCSPWAVLGVVLVRAVTATPSYVVLPALVGGQASLNLFTAIVGPSGGGKGAAESAAAECIDFGDRVETFGVGSGEGLVQLYATRRRRGKDEGPGWETVRLRDAVILSVPEVDNLAALGGRTGATLLPLLRQAWSGETLGFAYSDPEKALRIPKHTYRAGLVLGVQPGRAGALLDDADGGTPQRFIWMPVTEAHAPDVPPPCPRPIDLYGQYHGMTPPPPGQRIEMSVPDQARRIIDQARLERLRGVESALDGHALLCRLKVAAALCLLACRTHVNDDDWELAGTIMAVSEATRNDVVAHLREANEARNVARGRLDGVRVAVTEDTGHEIKVARVAKRIVQRSTSTWQTQSEIGRATASRDRDVVEEALEKAVAAGVLECEEAGGTMRYRAAIR